MEKDQKIYVVGHCGMVGSAILRRLKKEGYENLVTRTRLELDLTCQASVHEFFKKERPDFVFFAAGKVGGIHANVASPAEFILDNLLIETNIIDAAFRSGATKLLFPGCSCAYPRSAHQPIVEDSLLTGELEPTNEFYAVAKIAGIKMCQAYRRQYDFKAIVLMPTSLYGPGDNFNSGHSHVLPALLCKFYEAKRNNEPKVVVGGTGTPRREFMHVDDLASAALFLMKNYDDYGIVNVGVGEDITIRELAEMIKDVIDYKGAIGFDTTKPDGMPRKLLDSSKLNALGWKPEVLLREGIQSTFEWFKENQDKIRK